MWPACRDGAIDYKVALFKRGHDVGHRLTIHALYVVAIDMASWIPDSRLPHWQASIVFPASENGVHRSGGVIVVEDVVYA